MSHQDPFVSIDSAELALATGGWNPFKSAWNEAKKLGNSAAHAVNAGIDYVKQHPDILLQGGRML
jgi:hypothetical protein